MKIFMIIAISTTFICGIFSLIASLYTEGKTSFIWIINCLIWVVHCLFLYVAKIW